MRERLSFKLSHLGNEARYDLSGSILDLRSAKTPLRFSFIYPAVGKSGCVVKLFKVLQTNMCENNCRYCAIRKDRNIPRLYFKPKELAGIFMEYYRRGEVQGLFLSSAVFKSPDRAQEMIIETLRILRRELNYKGYIHAKILPGVSYELIGETAKWVDRLSINLEAPSGDYLTRLSKDKNWYELYRRLKLVSEVTRKFNLRAGAITQLVVGPANENDRDILRLTEHLYRGLKLSRVYYSGFTPIVDTPLENTPPAPWWREVRLYQADMLVKKYGFRYDELPFDKNGNLPYGVDPKLGWALKHPELFPVEINRAPYEMLIRVPGIGRVGARRILEYRKVHRFRYPEELRTLGINAKRALNFITIDGKSYFTPRLMAYSL